MTAQELYQMRRAALRNQQRPQAPESGLINMMAGGVPVDQAGPTSVPLDAEQGPAMGGGLLNKSAEQGPAMGGGITSPGKTHFFIKGRGPTIDFGPIFKPRSTGVNPMTGDPFEATSGVGGFFRRLLGDNSDELNAEWQKERMRRQIGLEDKAAERLARAEELAATQGFHGNESEAERQARKAVVDAELAARKTVSDAQIASAEKLQAAKLAQEKTLADSERSAQFLRDASQFGYATALQKMRNEGDINEIKLRNEGDINEVTARGLYSGLGGGGGGTRGGRGGSGITSAKMDEPMQDEKGRWFRFYIDENNMMQKQYVPEPGESATGQGDPTADSRNMVKQAMAAENLPGVVSDVDKPSFSFGEIGGLVGNEAKSLIPEKSLYGVAPAYPVMKFGKEFLEKNFPSSAPLERLAKIKEAELIRKRAAKNK